MRSGEAHPHRQAPRCSPAGDEIIGAHLEPSNAVAAALRFKRRDQDDQDQARRRIALEATAGFEAVERRHDDVHQHQDRVDRGARLVTALLAVVRKQHAITIAGQEAFEQPRGLRPSMSSTTSTVASG